MSRFILEDTGLSDWSDGVQSAIKIMIGNIKTEVEFLERYGKQELTWSPSPCYPITMFLDLTKKSLNQLIIITIAIINIGISGILKAFWDYDFSANHMILLWFSMGLLIGLLID